MSPRPSELSAQFREAPGTDVAVWYESELDPNMRTVRFGETAELATLVVSLAVKARPGVPRTAWYPTSETDGGGWSFVVSAHAAGGGAAGTVSFHAENWVEAKRVALRRLWEAMRGTSAQLEAILNG